MKLQKYLLNFPEEYNDIGNSSNKELSLVNAGHNNVWTPSNWTSEIIRAVKVGLQFTLQTKPILRRVGMNINQ